MTLEELNNYIAEIKNKESIAINQVRALYAKSQEKCKIGDIITNQDCTVFVKKIGWNLDFSGNPYPWYSGDNLTKKLTTNKMKPEATIYGNDGVTLIKLGESA